MSCKAYVKIDFGVWCSWIASVFIFTRERGHSTPLSLFSALIQTDRDRVKGKRERKGKVLLGLIPDLHVRIKPLNHIFQEVLNVGGVYTQGNMTPFASL